MSETFVMSVRPALALAFGLSRTMLRRERSNNSQPGMNQRGNGQGGWGRFSHFQKEKEEAHPSCKEPPQPPNQVRPGFLKKVKLSGLRRTEAEIFFWVQIAATAYTQTNGMHTECTGHRTIGQQLWQCTKTCFPAGVPSIS